MFNIENLIEKSFHAYGGCEYRFLLQDDVSEASKQASISSFDSQRNIQLNTTIMNAIMVPASMNTIDQDIDVLNDRMFAMSKKIILKLHRDFGMELPNVIRSLIDVQTKSYCDYEIPDYERIIGLDVINTDYYKVISNASLRSGVLYGHHCRDEFRLNLIYMIMFATGYNNVEFKRGFIKSYEDYHALVYPRNNWSKSQSRIMINRNYLVSLLNLMMNCYHFPTFAKVEDEGMNLYIVRNTKEAQQAIADGRLKRNSYLIDMPKKGYQMKVGKALNYVFGDLVPECFIELAMNRFRATFVKIDESDYHFHIATTQEEIEYAFSWVPLQPTNIKTTKFFKNNMSSCMRYPVNLLPKIQELNSYNLASLNNDRGFEPLVLANKVHPSAQYANPDFYVAYLSTSPIPMDTSKDTFIVARSVIGMQDEDNPRHISNHYSPEKLSEYILNQYGSGQKYHLSEEFEDKINHVCGPIYATRPFAYQLMLKRMNAWIEKINLEKVEDHKEHILSSCMDTDYLPFYPHGWTGLELNMIPFPNSTMTYSKYDNAVRQTIVGAYLDSPQNYVTMDQSRYDGDKLALVILQDSHLPKGKNQIPESVLRGLEVEDSEGSLKTIGSFSMTSQHRGMFSYLQSVAYMINCPMCQAEHQKRYMKGIYVDGERKVYCGDLRCLTKYKAAYSGYYTDWGDSDVLYSEAPTDLIEIIMKSYDVRTYGTRLEYTTTVSKSFAEARFAEYKSDDMGERSYFTGGLTYKYSNMSRRSFSIDDDVTNIRLVKSVVSGKWMVSLSALYYEVDGVRNYFTPVEESNELISKHSQLPIWIPKRWNRGNVLYSRSVNRILNPNNIITIYNAQTGQITGRTLKSVRNSQVYKKLCRDYDPEGIVYNRSKRRYEINEWSYFVSFMRGE